VQAVWDGCWVRQYGQNRVHEKENLRCGPFTLLQGHRIRDITGFQSIFSLDGVDGLNSRRRLLENNEDDDALDDATIGVFSAYHDPVLNEVRIFSEVHPRGVCPKFHRCATSLSFNDTAYLRRLAVFKCFFGSIHLSHIRP
jgi:hypothetical protein